MRLYLLGLTMGLAASANACSLLDPTCVCTDSSSAGVSEPAFVMARPAPPVSSFSTTVVHVFNFDYSTAAQPGPITDAVVNAGDTVQFVLDSGFHTATSVVGAPESFDSGVLVGSYSKTFNTPGVYEYYCAIHGFDNGNGTAGGMSGKITVLAVPEPATALLILPATMLMRRRK